MMVVHDRNYKRQDTLDVFEVALNRDTKSHRDVNRELVATSFFLARE